MTDEAKAIKGSTSARQLRRARARRFVWRLLLWVVIPTVLAVIYYGLWASPQYRSVAVIAVQSNAGGKSSSNKRDAMLVRRYSLSRTMLNHLVAENEFNTHHQDSAHDYWSRLATDASSEDSFAYYHDKVKMVYEAGSGTLALKVLAFSPEAAQRINAAIITAAEEMVNAMSERARNDRLGFAEDLLGRAEERLAKATKAVAQPTAETVSDSDAFERQVAQKSYEVALDTLERARLEVLREKRYVVTISAPSLPSGAVLPRRLWGIATVFILSIVLMAVLTMLAAAVREHARF